MKTIIERLFVIWDEERLTAKWLAERTGVKETRWYEIRRRKVMRTNELEVFQKLFPEYDYWVMSGKEIPEAGQISPMTKKLTRS
jgi:hypothetical protein